MGCGKVHQDQVGVHANLQHTAFGLPPLGPGAAHCGHHHQSLGRQGSRVLRLQLGKQGSRLHLLKEVQVVVGSGGVGAQRHIHPRLHHIRHGSHTGNQLQVGDGTVYRADPLPGQQAHVLPAQVVAMGSSSRDVKHPVAIQQLGRRQATPLLALPFLSHSF